MFGINAEETYPQSLTFILRCSKVTVSEM